MAEFADPGSGSSQPVLVALGVAMAQILDSPTAAHSKPAAAGRLVAILDKLHASAAPGPRGKLALVKAMTIGGDAPP